MKKFSSVILGAVLALFALTFASAAPDGGLVAKVDWLLAQFGKGNALKEDAGRVPPLGTIVPSALPYELMPDGFKKSWYPADGRSIAGTAFGKLLAEEGGARAAAAKTYPHLFVDNKPIAPDLRGVFLRGLNGFDSAQASTSDVAKGDPEAEADQAKNRLKRSVGGWQADEFKSHNHAPPLGQNAPWVSNPFNGDGAIDASNHTGVGERNPVGGNTQDKGGTETRPRNIAVYYYIRVN